MRENKLENAENTFYVYPQYLLSSNVVTS